jgi:C1A family cysteine protease
MPSTQQTSNDLSWPFNDDKQLELMRKAVPHQQTDGTLTFRWGTGNWGSGWGQSLRARNSTLGIDTEGQRMVTMGYHPDLPDWRDRSIEKLSSELAKQVSKLTPKRLPARINNIPWCSPIEDQGDLGSCTAQAVVGLLEYMQRRSCSSRDDYIGASRLFLYKASRNLLGWKGDTGAYLRTAVKAAAIFGVPPEQHWPYVL